MAVSRARSLLFVRRRHGLRGWLDDRTLSLRTAGWLGRRLSRPWLYEARRRAARLR